MVAFPSGRFVFHCSVNRYGWPAGRRTTVWTSAALGEKTPAKPPDSFQPTSVSAPPSMLTKMPMSWLYPVLLVHRSALAPTTATALLVDDGWLTVNEASDRQSAAPLFPINVCCWVVSA